MVEGRYRKHTKTINKKRHPKYIADKILNLDQSQFGYNAFGLRDKLHGNLYKSIRNRLI